MVKEAIQEHALYLAVVSASPLQPGTACYLPCLSVLNNLKEYKPHMLLDDLQCGSI